MRIRVLNKDPLYDFREANKITQGIDMNLVNDFVAPKNGDMVAFWIKQIIANHSCLRSIRFRVIDTQPKSVVMQIIRATKGHPQPEVQSSRPDWTGVERSSDPYEDKLFMQDHTAESFIEMAKQRLCERTEKNTRDFMWSVVHAMVEHENPFIRALGYCCHPACWWNAGKCPEINSCCKTVPKLADKVIAMYEGDKKWK